MQRWSSLLVALMTLCWIGTAARADDGLVGKWKIESGVKNGEKAKKENFENVKIEVTKEKIILESKMNDMEAKFVMTYKTNGDSKPNGIEMTIAEGPEGAKGMSAKGIFELKGDTLKLCYPPMGGDTPKAFESKADSGLYLWTLKKVK